MILIQFTKINFDMHTNTNIEYRGSHYASLLRVEWSKQLQVQKFSLKRSLKNLRKDGTTFFMVATSSPKRIVNASGDMYD